MGQGKKRKEKIERTKSCRYESCRIVLLRTVLEYKITTALLFRASLTAPAYLQAAFSFLLALSPKVVPVGTEILFAVFYFLYFFCF